MGEQHGTYILREVTPDRLKCCLLQNYTGFALIVRRVSPLMSHVRPRIKHLPPIGEISIHLLIRMQVPQCFVMGPVFRSSPSVHPFSRQEKSPVGWSALPPLEKLGEDALALTWRRRRPKPCLPARPALPLPHLHRLHPTPMNACSRAGAASDVRRALAARTTLGRFARLRGHAGQVRRVHACLRLVGSSSSHGLRVASLRD